MPVANYGTSWHVAGGQIASPYRAFSREKIFADVGVHIGLDNVNITLKGRRHTDTDTLRPRGGPSTAHTHTHVGTQHQACVDCCGPTLSAMLINIFFVSISSAACTQGLPADKLQRTILLDWT